jgi:2-keto-4-pentenoate hydratase/2-oxohepta-3-ene-1,7-dioic acid hydratase in catechol pathway
MKLLSYEHAGRASWGIVTPSGVIDLAAASAGRFPSLRSALAQDALEHLARDFAARAPDVALKDIRYLPVIPDAQKIFCVGLNYEEHRVEANRPKTGEPTIFLRTPTSQVGHDDAIVLPRESSSLDYEGEIAIVIGRAGRRISEGDAWSHIAGYSAYNDASVRDWQTHTSQWTGGKNFDATGGFGPCLVTRDEIEDDEELTLVTRLNGVEMQRATTKMMIFGIPRLIAYLSTFATLLPGDVIVTGTPGGVGFKRTPPVFMADGDTVEIEVSKVGTLVNRIARD